jgi:hypothetical protein
MHPVVNGVFLAASNSGNFTFDYHFSCLAVKNFDWVFQLIPTESIYLYPMPSVSAEHFQKFL